MKKILGIVLATALLSYTAVASATPGGSDDPFISKNYIDGTFSDEVLKSVETSADSKMSEVYDAALNKLREKALGSGYSYTSEYRKVTVPDDHILNVTTGGSAVLFSGSAVNKLSAVVIDVSEGAVVPAEKSLTSGHRYFTGENSVSGYLSKGDSTFLVKGFYTVTDGSGTPYIIFNENTFSDVKKTDWYYDAVGYGYTNSITNGATDSAFLPGRSVTRGEFITFIYRVSGEEPSLAKSSFTDVSLDAFYSKAVIWATECGIVDGYDDGTFRPNNEISREQMVTMMYRYAYHRGYSLGVSDSGRIKTFADSSAVSSYAESAMTWAVGNSIINGTDIGLEPLGTASRAQAMQIIYNFAMFFNL